MRFSDALSFFSSSDGIEIARKLQILAQHSALGLQTVSNLNVELRLTHAAWLELLGRIKDSNDRPTEIATAITTSLRPFILTGPTLGRPLSAVYGRAISMERFCRLLVKLGYYCSFQSARRGVQYVLTKPRYFLKRHWRDVDLGRFLLWSTFVPSSSDPFRGLPNSADVVRGHLGLDRNERGMPLLLFAYKLPRKVQPKYPTVADAYAADDWNYFFRPSPEGAQYGMTMPWPEYQNQPSRPEAVHEVIKAKSLISPLRRIV